MPLAHGSTAPSRMVSEGSGMIRSGSISARVPSPWQSVQKPSGVLKEKFWGASSPKERPQAWQAFSSEKKRSCFLYSSGSMPGPTFCSLSASATTSVPLPSRSAVSTESVSRERIPSFTTRRSTTSSMSCFSFLSRASRSVS